MWWERCVKPQLQREIRSYEAEKRRCYRTMEKYLYTCIYEILRSDIPPENKRSHLNRYKAKLCRLLTRQMRTNLLDTSMNDRMEEQDPSLYHIIRNKQRREQREINKVTDHMGVLHTTPQDITQVFVQHYTSLFASRRVEEVSIQEI
jgi:hypothetical protein